MQGISITLIFTLMWMLKDSTSPLKMSLFLTVISVLSSFLMYSYTNSTFISCCLVISFSSGMMILFSYCSMCTNHENKNKMEYKNYLYLPLIWLLIILSSNTSMYNSTMTIQKFTNNIPNSLILIFMMILVIITMVCMNKSFFNPTKKLMQSY